LPEKGIHYVTLHLKRRYSLLERYGIEFGLVTKKMMKKKSQSEKEKENETVYYSSWPQGQDKFKIGGLHVAFKQGNY
jgi:hypothetical protein